MVGRPRLLALAKNLGLAAGALLLTLVAAEIMTRLFADVTPPLKVNDPVIGERYRRSYESTVFVPEAGRRVLLRFDRDGFRGPDRPERKPPGTRRIAVLGDSMIAAVAVDEKDTLVADLERRLNRSHPAWSWEVLNFGVSGSGTSQELVVYRQVAARYHPDIVLCAFFVGNDLTDSDPEASTKPRVYFDLNDQGGLRPSSFSARRARINRWLNEHSRFYVWQNDAVRRLRHRLSGDWMPGHWIYARQPPPEIERAWRLNAALLERFRDEVEQDGAAFALVVLPAAPQIYADELGRIAAQAGGRGSGFDADHPDRRLAALCKEDRIPICSMTDDFRRAAPHRSVAVRDEWLFFHGTWHFNEKGHALAAEAIHRFLTRPGGLVDCLSGTPPGEPTAPVRPRILSRKRRHDSAGG